MKSKIIELKRGINFLGFRIFPYHKLLRKVNIRTMYKKIAQKSHDDVSKYLNGWFAYASWGDTYKLREDIRNRFLGGIQNAS